MYILYEIFAKTNTIIKTASNSNNGETAKTRNVKRRNLRRKTQKTITVGSRTQFGTEFEVGVGVREKYKIVGILLKKIKGFLV